MKAYLMSLGMEVWQSVVDGYKIPTTLVHLGQIPTVRSTQLPLYIVGRMTNNEPPQTSFHMMSLFRCHRYRLYCDV
jgi:hypothetical protein